MSARVEGGRSLRVSTAAALVLPAVVMLLGVVGATTGPLLEVRGSRARFHAAEEMLAGYHAERARLIELRKSVDPERVDELAAELDAMLPAGMEPVDAHALLRLAARATGFALDSIEIGPLYDLVAVVDGETVYMQDVRVSGEDDLVGVVRYVHALRQHGFPTVVTDLTLSRPDTRSERFSAQLHLGLLHRGAPPPPALVAGFDGGDLDLAGADPDARTP